MFGACAEEGRYLERDWETFMHLGTHSLELPEDKDIEIVCVQHSVQVDMPFCSTRCMRRFFDGIIDRLEDNDRR